jgi:hypothetical protein
MKNEKGRAIVVASWIGTALVALSAVPALLDAHFAGVVSLSVSLGLFFLSLFVWVYAFVVAASRSAGGEEVQVANLFLFDKGAPKRVRVHLFGSVGVCTVIALAVAAKDPFAVLTPMWPLGCCGLWGARHGTFPPRRSASIGRTP